MRLLVVTARFPTPDRPAAGAFVRDRLGDLDAVVVAPARYDLPGWRRYLSLTWRALSARGRFDGVEGHFVLPSGAVALLAARLRGVPLVVYAHGRDVREIASRNPLLGWLARRVVRGAAAVVTNSSETAGLVAALGREAEVIPPGIDLSRFDVLPRPGDRRVLYLGGDVPHKGVDVARQLADTLVGPGIRELDPSQVPALMAEHDVVLVPSLAEPFGLVAAEAIASGRWVVARSVGGLREIVQDGVNGTLVDDGDFATALANVPDYDPQTVAATAGRFSVETHRRRMDEVWRRVLAGRGGRA
ncbi:MAG TPA: glycosyltransferase [Candidatus Limnocylindria bacterium]|nr:glycosyltransferase [Candidatus Limnocylindria bacterium]